MATKPKRIAVSPQLDAAKLEIVQLKSKLAAEKAKVNELSAALDKSRHKVKTETKKAPRVKLGGDYVEVVFGDLHGNKHDPLAWSALIQDIAAIDPHRIVLGGDIIDCGGFLAEHHTLGYVAETADSYEDDCRVANQLLDQLQNTARRAQEIHYIEGNHEHRVERWCLTQKLSHHKDIDFLRRIFCAQSVLSLEKRGIKFYEQGKCHMGLDVPGWIRLDKVYFTHRLSGARDAAEQALNKTASNVIFFDSHQACYKPLHKLGTGLISAFNPGCMCKRQPMYMHTNPSRWTHGYCVRFISRKTGNFCTIPVAIGEESFGNIIFNS